MSARGSGEARPTGRPAAGTSRTLRFLERMDLAILASHRTVAPHGLFGAAAGSLGRTEVRRRDGTIERLAGCDQTVLEPGEAVIVTTPTGGGFSARLTRRGPHRKNVGGQIGWTHRHRDDDHRRASRPAMESASRHPVPAGHAAAPDTKRLIEDILRCRNRTKSRTTAPKARAAPQADSRREAMLKLAKSAAYVAPATARLSRGDQVGRCLLRRQGGGIRAAVPRMSGDTRKCRCPI